MSGQMKRNYAKTMGRSEISAFFSVDRSRYYIVLANGIRLMSAQLSAPVSYRMFDFVRKFVSGSCTETDPSTAEKPVRTGIDNSKMPFNIIG